jgi:amino acid transporter
VNDGPSPANGGTAQPDGDKRLSIVGVAFLGVGSMVGAGIFALLGEAAVVAGSAVWLSFLLAGAVTLLLAYNVISLGVRYPSSGGLIEYLQQGFGNGRLLGIAAWLGYFAAFVIVTAMVAVSFGAYAVSLFGTDGAAWDNVFTSILIVAMTAINLVGTQFVARVASVLVVVLLSVFAVFIVVTISDIDLDLLAFSGYPPFADIIASIALTFFAFLGFGVMTFAVGSLRNPRRELPRAMILALGLTTATYVLIAVGVFGTLTVDEAIRYGETAIAEAARPALGDAGFTIMAVAALLATAGATNATIFASANLTATLADLGQFPPIFGHGSRLGRHGGLLITAALVLVIANLVDLSAIASVGSACSLMVFLLVGLAGYRLRRETGANAFLVLLGMAVTVIVLGFFAVDTLENSPETFTAMVGIAALAVALDLIWKHIRPSEPSASVTSQLTPSQ